MAAEDMTVNFLRIKDPDLGSKYFSTIPIDGTLIHLCFERVERIFEFKDRGIDGKTSRDESPRWSGTGRKAVGARPYLVWSGAEDSEYRVCALQPILFLNHQ